MTFDAPTASRRRMGGDIPTAKWPQRYTVVSLSFVAFFICYLDRVNLSVAIIPMAEQFGWSPKTQGEVLSAFFVGYLLLQIAGGRLADRFGGRVVLGGGVLFSSLFTAITPLAALSGLTLLLLARVAIGLGESVTYPALMSIYSRSVPLPERSRAMGLTGSATPLGTIFGLAVTPVIARNLGWPWAFYLFGLAGLLWYPWWRRMARESPNGQTGSKDTIRGQTAAVPWRGFLASRPVWALIVGHFANNWSLYVLLSWLPTFLNQGLGVDYANVGWLAMIPYVAGFIFFNVAGNIADRLVRGGMKVGTVRKVMQTFALSGVSVALLVVGEVHTAWAAVAVMAVGNAVGAFGVGGILVNHMDIAPRHAGTLAGITNTAGTIPGIVGIYITGWILEITGSWPLVFQTAAVVSLTGMVVFLLFSSGEKQFD